VNGVDIEFNSYPSCNGREGYIAVFPNVCPAPTTYNPYYEYSEGYDKFVTNMWLSGDCMMPQEYFTSGDMNFGGCDLPITQRPAFCGSYNTVIRKALIFFVR